MKTLSQRCPVWAGDYIGKTRITIGKQGCLITCLSMISDYYKMFKTPAWMADNLFFTKDALLIWNSVTKNKGLNFDFIWRGYAPNYTAIDKALKDPNTAVVLEVEHYHWVLATSKVPFTRLYWIADPWTGTRRLSNSYKYISGYATFKRRGTN